MAINMAETLLRDTKLFCTETEAKLNGKAIEITPMERRLLVFFMERPNETLSRETLLQNVWDYVPGSVTRTVDSHVKKLRRHLGGFGDCIVTVRGVGYRLEPGRKKPRLPRGGVRPCKKDALKSEAEAGVSF